jgi:hypothetical protein
MVGRARLFFKWRERIVRGFGNDETCGIAYISCSPSLITRLYRHTSSLKSVQDLVHLILRIHRLLHRGSKLISTDNDAFSFPEREVDPLQTQSSGRRR